MTVLISAFFSERKDCGLFGWWPGWLTLVDDLTLTAGGTKVVPQGPVRYPAWSPGQLPPADPDVTVVSPHPGDPDPTGFFDVGPAFKPSQETVSRSLTQIGSTGQARGLLSGSRPSPLRSKSTRDDLAGRKRGR